MATTATASWPASLARPLMPRFSAWRSLVMSSQKPTAAKPQNTSRVCQM